MSNYTVRISDYLESRRFNRKLYGRLCDKLKPLTNGEYCNIKCDITLDMNAKYQTPTIDLQFDENVVGNFQLMDEVGSFIQVALDEIGFEFIQIDIARSSPAMLVVDFED